MDSFWEGMDVQRFWRSATFFFDGQLFKLRVFGGLCSLNMPWDKSDTSIYLCEVDLILHFVGKKSFTKHLLLLGADK